ncbi:MAG: SelB C-terminal domain-containing protein, partial [Actinomycetota bacterium]|nr:SelB C-terminal domain-containing protein [Actinomycetota bacterium]
RLPAADPAAPVRLWVDRAFTIRGSGTVVTGTLQSGTLREHDELVLGDRLVRVRGLQSLGRSAGQVEAVARVAVNLRGVDKDDVRRGDALLTPGRWTATSTVDARIKGGPGGAPARLVLHVGAAAVPVHVRMLGGDTARLALSRPLPLRVGDVALLRDPGRHAIVGGVTVLDVDPPPLTKRGAGAQRAEALALASGRVDARAEIRRRRFMHAEDLTALGAEPPYPPVAAGWLVDPEAVEDLRRLLAAHVEEHARRRPLERGIPVDELTQRLDLPDRVLVGALVSAPLVVRNGRVVDPRRAGVLPAPIAGAVAALSQDLAVAPFAAPEAHRLSALGLGPRELAAAERAGALLRVDAGVVLLPGADHAAVEILRALPQPFTLSEARQALGTTRRVAVPLLELLDRRALTRRLPDDRRVVAG